MFGLLDLGIRDMAYGRQTNLELYYRFSTDRRYEHLSRLKTVLANFVMSRNQIQLAHQIQKKSNHNEPHFGRSM